MADPLFDAIRDAVNPYVYPGERMSPVPFWWVWVEYQP